MSRMNFPAYFQYVNTAGKVSARSLMEIEAVILTILEEQEKINLQNEENFKQIFEILAKLVKKEPNIEPTKPSDNPKTAGIEESGTTSKEALRLKRIENLKKAREARKAKTNPTV